MENAFDALKMAFAVIVFVIALAIAFSLLSQANATAQQIFFGIDKITYLDHEKYRGEHRTVGLETIIPTVYTYSIKKYAVTIIDKNGKIIARYDQEASNVANQIKNHDAYNPDDKNVTHYNAYVNYSKYIDYVITVLRKLNNLANVVDNDYITNDYHRYADKTEIGSNCQYSEALDDKIKKLYTYKQLGDSAGNEYYGNPWKSFEAERLEADFYGGTKTFGINEYRLYDEDKGLIYLLKDKKFTEYVIEQDTEYMNDDYTQQVTPEGEKTAEGNSSEKRESTKLEIFYVEQDI